MTELLALQGDEKVLEVGTGSGYQTAVLARLAAQVFTVERIASLSQRAERILAELKIDNVQFHVGDGSLGWPEHAPYDAILVTCAAPQLPAPLLEQLADGGRMVTPVGPRGLSGPGAGGQKGRRFRRGAAVTGRVRSPDRPVRLVS